MSGRPSTDSKIQVSPSIGSLVGVGSGTAVEGAVKAVVGECSGTAMGVAIRGLMGTGSVTAVASASSDGVTGCGPLQATATMTARAKITVAAPEAARMILVLSSLIGQFLCRAIGRL